MLINNVNVVIVAHPGDVHVEFDKVCSDGIIILKLLKDFSFVHIYRFLNLHVLSCHCVSFSLNNGHT